MIRIQQRLVDYPVFPVRQCLGKEAMACQGNHTSTFKGTKSRHWIPQPHHSNKQMGHKWNYLTITFLYRTSHVSSVNNLLTVRKWNLLIMQSVSYSTDKEDQALIIRTEAFHFTNEWLFEVDLKNSGQTVLQKISILSIVLWILFK